MVESGHPVTRRTLRFLDVGLQWTSGDCENLLVYGETPTPLETRAEPSGPDLRDENERKIWALTDLPEETRRALIDVKRGREASRDPKPLPAPSRVA